MSANEIRQLFPDISPTSNRGQFKR